MEKTKYDVVIIGGGIVGCCVAFELAKRNVKNILILERGYITSGATGRCSAGFRHSWGTPINLELSTASIEIFTQINKYTGYKHDCEVTQSGYLLPAYTEGEMRTLSNNIKLQHELGVRSEVLDVAEMKKIVPYINPEGILGAGWNQDDGHANPFHCNFAFATGAKRMGVEIATFTEAQEIKTVNGKVVGLQTSRGYVETSVIYNCANSWAPLLAAQVGDELPIRNERHQNFVTEPVDPMGVNGAIMPMVMSFSKRIMVKQTPHGSFLFGYDDKPEPSYNDKATWEFLEVTTGLIAQMIPIVRKLRVVREYAGFYDVSPDHTPIIEFSKKAEGMVHICGFSGHGFMVTPRLAIMVARHYCGESDELDIDRFSMQRFETGCLLNEPLCV